MAEKNDIDAIREFINNVKSTFEGGIATEHTYRPVLKILCDTIGAGDVYAVNEPKRIACGSPDLALMHEDIAIGYLEAKDIDININRLNDANKNQFERYTNDLDNLIYTNCLDWNFYRNGEQEHGVSIAEIQDGRIILKPDSFIELAKLLKRFLERPPQTITTPQELTEYMAKRTKMICYSIEKSMLGGDPLESLINQHTLIDEMLVKDISIEEFANMYAQTITYGLFVAKLQSESNNNPAEIFVRQNIPNLLPTTYPFLSKLFSFIASDELKEKLDRPIDDLVTLYRASNVTAIMATYGQNSGREDPFIHFYEDFLTAYNPAERKRSGVYYTPEPVVDFIVRGVDWVLKNKFNIRDGLANSEKTNVPWKTDRVGDTEYKDVHKIQILDPATGTGTFLAQTIRHIAGSIQASAPNNWSSYVDNDLLPRLHGFEFMMAPYAMCYLKLDMVLDELNYTPTENRPDRMSIYLTNSLTAANKDIPPLPFIEWLEDEARGAADIKDNFPIMCVIGNPPYNIESKNNDPWILNLIKDYKKEPDSATPLQERKHWLNDDYVKFIRMAEYMVDMHSPSGRGVVGMITSHGYLDNPTFRGMRWHLMGTFDEIYILDLHGNSRKKEVSPNGDPDENVFDIMAGVSIIIAWAKEIHIGQEIFSADVFHADLWGTREEKFKALSTENLDSKLFQKLKPQHPDYFFTPKNYDLLREYKNSFKITDFMSDSSTGIFTLGDGFIIAPNKTELHKRLDDFLSSDITEAALKNKFGLGKNYAKWILGNKTKIKFDSKKLVKITYRPFDTRWTYFDNNVLWRWRKGVMQNFLAGANFGLVIGRQGQVVGSMPWNVIFVQDQISDLNIFYRGGGAVFPLYIYPDEDNLDKTIRVNMDPTIHMHLEKIATDPEHGTPDEQQIFDYIYGILHTPQYRERYAEFLKSDFPRIPYPETPAEFWHLSSVGTKLRELHLMSNNKEFETTDYVYRGKGDNIVERVKFDGTKAWINQTQYLDNVPESAWDFYIGGYQPAQKWLKDRRGKTLDQIDITHYQRIIAVLVQTQTTMDDIKWSRP